MLIQAVIKTGAVDKYLSKFLSMILFILSEGKSLKT